MVKIAFVGFRHPHINTLYNFAKENPRVEIVAAFEADEAARAAAAETLGVNFTHDSLEALLKEDVDIVAIGDYYGARGQEIIAALKAGKHVYSDKPLCTSINELDEICRLQKETGKLVGCMLDMRYLPWVRPVKKFLSEGGLGDVHAISFGGQHPLMYGKRASWYFEEGCHGGTVNDIAIHGIDLVEYFTGKKIEKIDCVKSWNAFATEVEHFDDCAQVMATLTGGTGLMVDVSYAAPTSCGYVSPYYWRFTVWGTKGVMEFNYNSEDVRLWLEGNEGEVLLEKDTEPVTNCLDVFLDELEGKDVEIDCEWTLRVCREVLELQAAAK